MTLQDNDKAVEGEKEVQKWWWEDEEDEDTKVDWFLRLRLDEDGRVETGWEHLF